MATRVRLADLAAMTKTESGWHLSELVRAAKAPRNGQLAEMNARIRVLELRYEMTSDEMRTRVRNGELKETAELVQWLFWLAARDSGTR